MIQLDKRMRTTVQQEPITPIANVPLCCPLVLAYVEDLEGIFREYHRRKDGMSTVQQSRALRERPMKYLQIFTLSDRYV